MTNYEGYEYVDAIATGRILTYPAKSIEKAVQNCLYTERLSNGNARVGPTGRVVHSGNRCVALVPEKKRPIVQ